MAYSSGGRAEELPPALPVKQHRSRSRSSADSFLLSPVGLQHQNYAYDDVFSEPTDCHADQCPIHQRYDPFRHEERFFSDVNPPPVPRKKLNRTLSLPGTNATPLCPWSPLSPLQRHPQNFDNPLYMLAPAPHHYFHQEIEEVTKVRRSVVPLLSFSQLSFDTPDEHLPNLFSSLDDQRVVSQGILHRHLLFLRSMALSVEAGILQRGEAAEKDASSYQPQDFLLTEDSRPKQIGECVYYRLHSPRFPGRVLGLKVHKHAHEAPTQHQLSHVNVQSVVAHFTPSSILKNDSSTLQPQDPSTPSISEFTAAETPGGGSTEYSTDPLMTNVSSVQSFLQRGHAVSVERDLPHVTLEDFVQETRCLQSTESLLYDRQVCVLLLQIITGAQHLYIGAMAAELRPQEIFLVWPCGARDERENKLDDSSEAKRSLKTSRLKEEREWETPEKKGKIQMLWRRQGSPRVVLNPQSGSHPLSSINSQIGALLQFCLSSQESSASSLSTSSYRRALLHLSSLLQNGSSGPQIADMVALLQVLLWGPHVALLNPSGPTTAATVHNWLTIKRALLVMKLAERGLIQDQSAQDWEECMCLQYLSFTDPETVVSVTSQLGLTLTMD
ncbi:inactive tyrosine-protein kinase PRAG1 [Hippoglossus hippoglossus]|uniref:inactive tyrosine-protein kinase PRAG1 n=1 Tax=Hippoglossus hippoglossus TaxID=8267 RepID=UPI00148E2CC5|nr:inactive tyrosine-protein kinase PRAG1 [Hippoglossus hippoglossus]